MSIRVRTPEELLSDPELDDAWKTDLLRGWEFDERQIAVAVGEGMPGQDPPFLRRILQALRALEKKHAVPAPTVRSSGSSEEGCPQ